MASYWSRQLPPRTSTERLTRDAAIAEALNKNLELVASRGSQRESVSNGLVRGEPAHADTDHPHHPHQQIPFLQSRSSWPLIGMSAAIMCYALLTQSVKMWLLRGKWI